jgi:hypothetical protein
MYSSAYRTFVQFLEMHSLWTTDGVAPPIISEHTLAYFVAYCVQRNLRYTTIKQYLAGIRHFYVAYGVPTPLCAPASLSCLQLILRGVKKSQTSSRATRLPITFPILTRLTQAFVSGVPGSYDGIMLAAALSMAFFGFLRCGEFTVGSPVYYPRGDACCLRIADIHFSGDGTSFILHLPQSKTDVFREGCNLILHSTANAVCPVQLMSKYLSIRTRAGAAESDPLFLTSQGRIMNRSFFVSSLKSVLERLGFNPALYNGHSVRIGSATSAGAAKVPDHLIKTLGRWTSDCYMRYIHTQAVTIRDAQQSMCLGSM